MQSNTKTNKKEKVKKVNIMTTYKLATNYFYGNKASDYAIENGFLDYATFAKSFDAVMNNDIISNTWTVR